jgi:hypothetical protein
VELRNRISKYPEILLFIPTLLIGAGYLVMQWGTSIEHLQIILAGYTLSMIGVILAIYIGLIAIYLRFLKREVEKKLDKEVKETVWNLFMVSYVAGIYGGITALAINFVLSAKSIYSQAITAVGLACVIVVGGLFGLFVLTNALKIYLQHCQHCKQQIAVLKMFLIYLY